MPLRIFSRARPIKSFTQDSGQKRYYNRYKIAEFYVQDDWRATSRLTINVGFRDSLFGAWYNPNNTAYNWRPEAFNHSLGSSIYIDPNNGYLVQRQRGAARSSQPQRTYSLNFIESSHYEWPGSVRRKWVVPDSCMSNTLFHPLRVWDFRGIRGATGKTAVRAGYGLFWEHGTGYEANVGSLIGSAPLVLSETQSNISGKSAFNSIGYSCQGGAAQCSSPAAMSGATFPLNVTSIPTKATYPYIQQWSLSVQREIHKAMVAASGVCGHQRHPSYCGTRSESAATVGGAQIPSSRAADYSERLSERSQQWRIYRGWAE